MAEVQAPLFVEVKFTASVLVPDTEIGDEWTVVLRGKVTEMTDKLRKGELFTTAKVPAERTLRIDPDEIKDATNGELLTEQLVGDITAFLAAEAEAAALTVTKAPDPIKGQRSVDPETGEILDDEIFDPDDEE